MLHPIDMFATVSTQDTRLITWSQLSQLANINVNHVLKHSVTGHQSENKTISIDEPLGGNHGSLVLAHIATWSAAQVMASGGHSSFTGY